MSLLYGETISRGHIWQDYMASFASGQNESNPALRLATRGGKKNSVESHIINPLLTKSVQSRRLDIGLVLFLRVYGPRRRLGP